MTSRVIAAVTVALLAATAACASEQPVAIPDVRPGTQTGKPTAPKTSAAKPAAKGVADVSINGSDRISCDSVDAEVELVAKEGTARWSASAKRSPNFADKLAAQGVQVSPASGELEEGDSAAIRVRGSFDKANKYFYVVVVSRDGSTSHAVEFKCR
jgi:type IV pilus biogenesis protein CpaD/CtpE